jgi:hypothetical protein
MCNGCRKRNLHAVLAQRWTVTIGKCALSSDPPSGLGSEGRVDILVSTNDRQKALKYNLLRWVLSGTSCWKNLINCQKKKRVRWYRKVYLVKIMICSPSCDSLGSYGSYWNACSFRACRRRFKVAQSTECIEWCDAVSGAVVLWDDSEFAAGGKWSAVR